jgi:hypothetical protein
MTDLRPAPSQRRRMRNTGTSMQPPHSHTDDSVDDPAPAPDAKTRAAPATTPPRRRIRPASVPGRVPAGHAILVIVITLVLAMLFNSRAMVHAGEGMKAGTTRNLVLGVAKPVDSFARAVWLDKPREGLNWLFGTKPAPTGPSELSKVPSKADDRPLGSAVTPKPGSSPGAGPSAGARPSAGATAAPQPATTKLRTVTAAAPLRLLIAGDSMTEFTGPALINQAASGGKVRGNTITKYGTGLVRPDFFDWSIFAKQLIAQQNPEAIVVMMGGNDGQGITLADGTVLPDGTDGWAKEYRRRVEVVMRIFADNGKRRVYWVPMPIPRNAKLALDYHLMDLAVADAASVVPGVVDVDIVNRLSLNGQYSDYLPALNGQTILARSRDGIHLSADGATLAASLILHELNKDWKLTK